MANHLEGLIQDLTEAAHEPLREGRCMVAKMLTDMDKPQQDTFESLLRSKMSGEKIASIMTKHGYPIAGQAVNNCRSGTDACRNKRR